MRSSPATGRLAAGAVAAGCVAVVVACGELSTGALIGVAVAGTLLTGAGLLRRSGEASAPVGRGGLPWLGWLGAAVGWELVALTDDGVPTVSDLLDPVLAHPGARGVAAAGWLAAGAWLLARPVRRRGPG